MKRSNRRIPTSSRGAKNLARAAPRSSGFNSPKANLERARAALLAGQLDEADKLCDRVLAKIRGNAEALHIKGLCARGRGDMANAIDYLMRAAKSQPERADIQYNLGITYGEAQSLDEAEAAYARAIDLDNTNPNYHNNLGNLLNRMGRNEEAVAAFRAALRLDESHVQALNNLGSTLLEMKQPQAAITELRRAIAEAPDYADAHNNLANAYVDAGDSAKAIDAYRKAIALRPGAAVFHYNLGNALLDTGRIGEAIGAYRKSLALNPDQPQTRSNLLYCSLYDPGATLDSLKKAHAAWAGRQKKTAATVFDAGIFDADKPLRLGFISADFGQHPIGYFTVLPFENLDRGQVQVFAYSERNSADAMTERIKAACDGWTDCRDTSDQELAAMIRDDGIDVLFDISGLSRGNRLGVFALKPAPLQINWTIGYPSTTGIAAIDAILSDARHIAPGDEAYFDEMLAFLPNGHFCFDPPLDAPDVAPPPFAANGFVTFGSFNQPRKTNDKVLEAWGRILTAVPDARLVLAYAGMDDSANRKRIEDVLGDGLARVEILGRASRDEVLARYASIDIGLDTFPYSGGLTTLEALWMGVPVITFPGATSAGRLSTSHLWAIGLHQLIAEDLDGYVELAVKLAGDRDRLTHLRASLRDQLAKSPICDGKQFAADFLSAVRDLWRQKCLQGS